MSKDTKSLSAFFNQNSAENLDNCARERVHHVGSVQAVGAMLIFEQTQQLRVLSLSSNIQTLLQLELLPTVGSQLSDCLPEMAAEVADFCYQDLAHDYFLLNYVVATTEEQYQVACHLHDDVGFLEFLPEGNSSVTQLRENLRILRTASTRIRDADTLLDAMQYTVDTAREISRFARVHIYQFQEDWTGKIVAESKADHMSSLNGLAFPAADIPEQARYLMALAPYRCVSSVEDDFSTLIPTTHTDTDEPFDLSWSILRSPSAMHTQYLRNMGVKATCSVSLMHRGRLWGMIACHHDAPAILPFDVLGLMADLGAALMAKLSVQLEKNMHVKLQDLKSIDEKVAGIVRDEGDLTNAIVQAMPELNTFLDGDGFAFQYEDAVYVDGRTPPVSFINALLIWANEHHHLSKQVYMTDALAEEWEDAMAFKATACGVLIVPVFLDRICYLIWFRGPDDLVTKWAGNPMKTEMRLETDGSQTLLPRRSFEGWDEQHYNRSKKWTEIEKIAASGSQRNILDIAKYQVKLVDNNRRMETFSHAAAHDIKAPLRHIRIMLDMMQASDEIGQHAALKDLADTALSAADRLRDLIDNLLQYLVLNDPNIMMETIQTSAIVDNVLQILGQELKQVDASITIGALPDVTCNSELLSTLLINLMTNAILYREPTRNLEIGIQGVQVDGVVEIAITDNGIGIPADKVNTIFEPFHRLHAFKQIAGSGLGLSISLLIAQLHGGTIEVDETHAVGTRMVVTLKS